MSIRLWVLIAMLAMSAPLAHADEWADCNSGDSEKRFRGCTAIIDANADTAKNLAIAYANRGYGSYFNGELDLAIADFDRAIALNPKYAEAHFARGLTYFEKGDLVRAIAEYDRAITRDPKNRKYLDFRCWALAIASKNLDQARADCDAVLAIENNPITLDFRGLIGLKQGRFDEAWNDYDTALRMAPSTASYLFGRGIAALRLGRTADGNADLAAATKLNGKIAEEYARYGVLP